MIQLRYADINDSDDLFRWRNDPQTRAMSRNTEPVTPEQHDQWMRMNVLQGYPSHLVMIAETPEYGKLGVVRFDAKKDVMTYEVGITIAPEYRGRGFSEYVLMTACSGMADYTLLAEIKPENFASCRIFQRIGFEDIASNHDFIKYKRKPLRGS